MDWIQTAQAFITEKWELLVAFATGTGFTGIVIRDLYNKFKFGSTKKLIKNFKADTSEALEEQKANLTVMKEAVSEMKVVANMVYELARNANIVKEAKENIKTLISSIIPTVAEIPEDETIEEITVSEDVENNNKSISDILAGL